MFRLAKSCFARARWVSGCFALFTLSAGANAQSPTPSPTDGPNSAAPGGQESEVGEAHQRFSRGVSFYREGDYHAAAIEFERAYELSPNFRVLYNIAQTRRELKDYAEALDAFERYLSLGNQEIPEERRAEVRQAIADLAGRVARISIVANVEGATVQVDGKAIGLTPLGKAVRVSAGRRAISVSKRGYHAATRTIDAAGGDESLVTLSLEPEARSETPAASRPRPATNTPPSDVTSSRGGLGSGFWIGVTVTSVLAVGGAVTGVIALDAKHDQEARLKTLGTSQGELDDGKAKVQRFALASDILFGAALVSGGLTAFFVLRDRRSTTAVVVSPGSVALRAAF